MTTVLSRNNHHPSDEDDDLLISSSSTTRGPNPTIPLLHDYVNSEQDNNLSLQTPGGDQTISSTLNSYSNSNENITSYRQVSS